jgi:hypothetical protein
MPATAFHPHHAEIPTRRGALEYSPALVVAAGASMSARGSAASYDLDRAMCDAGEVSVFREHRHTKSG